MTLGLHRRGPLRRSPSFSSGWLECEVVLNHCGLAVWSLLFIPMRQRTVKSCRFSLWSGRRWGRSICCGSILFATAVVGEAATFTWDGGASHAGLTANDNWTTGNNWVSGAPTSANDTALIFTASTVRRTATQNIANPFVLNSLTFDATSNVTNINGSQLSFTTLVATSLQPKLTQASPTNVNIGAPLLLSANLVVQLSGTGTLELSGAISGSNLMNTTGTGKLVLSGTNTFTGGILIGGGTVALNSLGALGTTGSIVFTGGNGTLQYTATNQTDYSGRFGTSGGQDIRVDTNGQAVTFASALVGLNTRLTKVGAGTLTIGGTAANTLNGDVTVLGGTLLMSKPLVGQTFAGNLVIGNASNPGAAGTVIARQGLANQTSATTKVTVFSDGVLDFNLRQTTMGNVEMTGGELRLTNATVSLVGDVTASAAGSQSALISSTDFTNDLDLKSGQRTFTVSRGTATYDLDVQAGVTQGNLVKAGPGVIRLAGVTNSGAAVTVQSGTLAVATDTALGTPTSLSTVLGTFTLAGGTVVADGGNRTIANPISIGGSATFGASLDGTPRSLVFTGAAALTTPATLTASNPAGTTLAQLDLGTNALTIAGSQSLVIGGAISGTAGITKNGPGLLSLAASNSFSGGLQVNSGAVVAKDGSSIGSGTVVLALGTTLAFTDQAVTLTQQIQAGTATLSPAAGGQITYSGSSLNSGTLGAGQHVLAAGADFIGTRVSTGAVVSQTGGTATWNNPIFSGTSSLTQASGAVLNVTGDFTSTPATAITLNGTMNLPGGSIGGALAIKAGGLLANTGGTLFVDGARGATIAAGGALSAGAGTTIELGNALTNDGTQSGALNVNQGGVIAGAGTFGQVTLGLGSRLAPGHGLGKSTLGSLTLETGATLELELASTQGLPGVGVDLAEISGSLDLSAGIGTAGAFKLSLVTLLGNGQAGSLSDFNPLVPFSLTVATAAGGITGFASGLFAIDLSAFANDLDGGSFAVEAQGNSLKLNYTPVPEPGGGVMVGVGAVVLGGLRRQRARR